MNFVLLAFMINTLPNSLDMLCLLRNYFFITLFLMFSGEFYPSWARLEPFAFLIMLYESLLLLSVEDYFIITFVNYVFDSI
jgi:hypothetical protein